MTTEEIKHVFEAYSSLSDAQEPLAAVMKETANERINHAKAHLDKLHCPWIGVPLHSPHNLLPREAP